MKAYLSKPSKINIRQQRPEPATPAVQGSRDKEQGIRGLDRRKQQHSRKKFAAASLLLPDALAGVLILGLVLALIFPWSAAAVEKVNRPILKGKVSDVAGSPLLGASIFVYDSPDIRRPVQFISTQTDADGRYEMVLDAGKYWVLARYKQGRYAIGPLIMGDRSSGEPEIIELANGDVKTFDFTVADLQEASRMMTKKPAGYLKITGRIIDGSGNPVKMAYAIASRKERVAVIPSYLSAWTEADGSYSLFLPPGTYYLGASDSFPPAQNYAPPLKVSFSEEKQGIDIIIDTQATPDMSSK